MRPTLAIVVAALTALLPLQAGAQAEPPKTAKPAAKAAKKPAAEPQKAAGAAGSTAPVGSLESEPDRKFGKQKEPCVYKPVMTQEDLENCR